MKNLRAPIRLTMVFVAASVFLSWTPAARADGLIDINTASEDQLDQLPGIGPSRARAIIEHRETNGPFTSVDALIQVRGIGPSILAGLRDRVTIGGASGQTAPEPPARREDPARPAPRRADGDFDLDLTRDESPAAGSVRQVSTTERQPSRNDPPQVMRHEPALPAAPASPSGLINLNTADEETLVRLRGIGPARARTIIAHRATQGLFRSTDEITQVTGIGPATYAGFRHMVTVQLDLNTAGLEELEAIGIDMQAAERIITWRRANGPFRTVEQITEVPGFGRGALETLRPFLWVGTQ